MRAELLPDEPSDLEPAAEEPSNLSDLEFPGPPFADEDEAPWEAFIPDDDELDPQPEAGDFWIDSRVRRAA